MEDFTQILSELEASLCEDPYNFSEVFYKYNNVFKNPSKLPINQIHLERTLNLQIREPPDDVDIERMTSKELTRYCETKKQVIPALHKSWIPQHLVFYNYQPYYVSMDSEKNKFYVSENKKFIKTLTYLLECSFHEFWCIVLHEPKLAAVLNNFLLNPIPSYEIKAVEPEVAAVYETVFSYVYWIYERLITFKKSEEEYMEPKFGLKCLLDKKLISLPTVITLSFLYKYYNQDFVDRINNLYFSDESEKLFQEKEVEDKVDNIKLLLEMTRMIVCRDYEKPVPIALDERPKDFSLDWVYSAVNYLLNTVTSLKILFDTYKPSVVMAMQKELPSKLSSTYDILYSEIYDMLEEREELTLYPELAAVILDQIALGRAEFLNAFNCFVTYLLDKALENQQNPSQLEEYAEMYLKLMNSALECECFICDYNVKYDVNVINEMFADTCKLDSTRTDYISKCVNNLPRNNKLTDIIKQKKGIETFFKNHVPKTAEPVAETSTANNGLQMHSGPSEVEVQEMIMSIIDMFPHLGDGFILKCLEAYDYKTSEVINAILEENLPPHLTEIPFDQIRIPAEPEPPKPVLAYRGKRPDLPEDFRTLLDDKKAKEEMKTYILEGVEYSSSQYDMYDDEYDDRDDDVPIPVYEADNTGDIITRFNPNYQAEELASDTSYSDEEYDETGKPVSKDSNPGPSNNQTKGKGDFCEDPAVIRARREAQYKGRQSHRGARNPNLVGKPKGQGQEKDVQKDRQKKSVNKSSRANHNRKTGAQWKRNRGMVPS